MIQRLLDSKNLIACLLAAATGMTLYIRMPFPEENFFLELLFLSARPVFLGLKYSYIVFLYTTPFLAYSKRLRALDARMSGLVLAPLILLAAFVLLQTPAIHAATGFPPDQFPVEARREIRVNRA